jgi:hypothetical protein
MEAHKLFVGVEISLAGTGEQDGFALGRPGQNCKLYTASVMRVPRNVRAATRVPASCGVVCLHDTAQQEL